jgi:chemotaxis-related protein WspB
MALFILFRLGGDPYAIEASQVVRVIPLASLKEFPQAPPGIAGLLDLHGSPVPVVDLSLCATGVPCRQRLTTRVMLVTYAAPAGNRLLGIMAEGVCRTERLDPEKFVSPCIDPGEARYLGPVLERDGELIQRIEPASLLTPQVAARLFPEESGHD